MYHFKSKIILRQIAFILLVSLTACNDARQTNNQANVNSKMNILKGTLWTSDFYHYHNNYYFITDSTGFSQDGQFLWSTAIDPSLYNNSRDSIGYDDDQPFKYSLKDTVLTIKYSSADNNTINDHRIFYLQKGDSDKILFISAYEYSYGHEGLLFKKQVDK